MLLGRERMSWSTPHTFVAAEATTAATLNTALNSDTGFLFTPPSCGITADPTTLPFWTVATGTTPTLLVGTGGGCLSLWDTDTMTNIGGATPNQITINTGGVYEVSLNGVWDQNATGAVRRAAIAWNGAYTAGQMCENGSAVTVEQTVTTMSLGVASSSTYQPWGAQNSGGALNFNPATADGTHAMFTATWMSAG
jgi:hypothetical protein